MYNIFTYGAEYIDRKEDKRYLNNISTYSLYVLISKIELADKEQMFSKSNLYNSIALPKVLISNSYKVKLGEEKIITFGFVDGDERLGHALNETNIDEKDGTVFIPYEIYHSDAEYNSEETFNIEDYKNKIVIVVPKMGTDDWRIFKAGERHKFFVAYFNFESISNEEKAYVWIIASNKDFDIVKTDYFYSDNVDENGDPVQDFDSSLMVIDTEFSGGEGNQSFKIISDGGFLVKSNDFEDIPLNESIVWFTEERDGSTIFSELDRDSNFLKLSIVKSQGLLVTSPYIDESEIPQIGFYKNDILIPFTDFDENGQYNMLKLNSDEKTVFSIKNVSGNVLDTQVVYKIYDGGDGATGSIYKPTGIDTDGSIIWEKQSDNESENEITLSNTIFATKEEISLKEDKRYHLEIGTPIATWEEGDSVSTTFALKYGDETVPVSELSMTSVSTGGSFTTDYPRLYFAVFDDDSNFATKTITITHSSGIYTGSFIVLRGAEDAIFVNSTNETYSVPCLSNGTFPSGTLDDVKTVISAYKGASITDFEITSISDTTHFEIDTDGATVKCKAMSSDVESCVISVEVGSLTIEKKFIVTKQKQGLIGTPGIPGKDSVHAVLTSETDICKVGETTSTTIELYEGGVELDTGVVYYDDGAKIGGTFNFSNNNATVTFAGFSTGSEIASVMLKARYNSNDYSKTYTVTKVSDGLTGIPSYTYFGYADDDTGDGFSAYPTGKTYMATLVTNVKITRELIVGDFSECIWFKFKGETGDDSVEYKISSFGGSVFKSSNGSVSPQTIRLQIIRTEGDSRAILSDGNSNTYGVYIYKEDETTKLTNLVIQSSEFSSVEKITYKLVDTSNSSNVVLDSFTITKVTDGVDGESFDITYRKTTLVERNAITGVIENETCFVSETKKLYFAIDDGSGAGIWDDGVEFGSGDDAISVILSRDTINIPYLYSGIIKDSNDKYITVSAFSGFNEIDGANFGITSIKDSTGGTFSISVENNKRLDFDGFSANSDVAVCNFNVAITSGSTMSTVLKTLTVNKIVDGINGIPSYVHIKFSDNSSGNPFDNVNTKEYMGIATTNSENAPTFYGDYVWTKHKGLDGNDSILYKIVSEDGNTFKYDDGAFYPSTVNLVIKKFEGSFASTYSGTNIKVYNESGEEVDLSSSLNVSTYLTSNEKYTFTLVDTTDSDAVLDSLTIVKLTDGLSGTSDHTYFGYKTNPTDDSENASETYDNAVHLYMAIVKNSNEDWDISYFEGSGINWMKIKGDVGDSNYIHVAYCNDPSSNFLGNNKINQNPDGYSKFMKTVVNNNIVWNSGYFSSPSNWAKFVGTDSIYAVLTSETDSWKTGSSLSATIELYKGGVKLTSGVTYLNTGAKIGGTFSFSNSNATVTFTGFSVGSESASIVLTAKYDNNNYSKTYTVTKVSDGDDAILYKIISSDGSTFKYNSSDNPPFHPSTMNLIIKEINGKISSTYSGTSIKVYNENGVAVNLSSSLDVSAYLTLNEKYTFTLKDTANSNAVLDSFTIVKLSDGSDGDNAINYTLSSVGGGVFKSSDGGTSYEPTTIELIINKIDGSSRTKILETNTDFRIRKFGKTAYLDDFIIEPDDVVGNQVYELVDVSDVNNIIVLDSLSIVKVTDGTKIESILTGANTILYIPMTSGVDGINQDLSTFSDIETWNDLGIEGGLVGDSYLIIGGVDRYLKITKELTQSINGEISFSFLYKPTDIISGFAPESSLFSLYGVGSDGQTGKKIAIIFTSRNYVDGTDNKIEIKYYYYESGKDIFTHSGIVSSDFEQRTETSDFNHFVIGVDNYNSNSFDFNMFINNSKETINIELGSIMELKGFDFLTLGLYDNRDDYFDEKYNSLLSNSASLPNDVSYYYDEFRILSTSLSGDNISLIYNNDGKIDNMLSAYLTNSVPDLLPSLNKTKYLDGSGYDSSKLNIGQILFDGTNLIIRTSKGLKTITIS